jgi:hypothetical protein
MIKGMSGIIEDDPIKKLRGVIQAVSIYTLVIGISFNNYIGSCNFEAMFQVCCDLAYMGIFTPSIDS